MQIQKILASKLVTTLTLLVFLTTSTPTTAAEKGWYLGVLIGQSSIVDTGNFNNFCVENFAQICADEDDDTAFQVLGGYQANDYVSMELAYFDLGSPAVAAPQPLNSKVVASMNGGVFSVLPQLPIGSIGTIYGRLGLAVGNLEVEVDEPLTDFRISDKTTGATLTVGIGGAINLGERVTVRVEWTRYAFDETLNLAGANIETPDVDVFGAALIFRFPKK